MSLNCCNCISWQVNSYTACQAVSLQTGFWKLELPRTECFCLLSPLDKCNWFHAARKFTSVKQMYGYLFLTKKPKYMCKLMSSYRTAFMVTNIHVIWTYQGIHSSHLNSTSCDRFGRINPDLNVYNFYGNTLKNQGSILLSIKKIKLA